MRYLLSVEQKVFFKQRGLIEFEELFSRDQVVDQDPRKLASHPTLLHLAGELFQQKALRFAFSRIIDLPLDLAASYTIQDLSCIQRIVGALMIGLEGATGLEANHDDLPFPQREGSVLFFSSNSIWKKEKLQLRAAQKCLLIAYAEPTARYVFNDKDPGLHALKALGYTYGDRLREEHFPSFFAK